MSSWSFIAIKCKNKGKRYNRRMVPRPTDFAKCFGVLWEGHYKMMGGVCLSVHPSVCLSRWERKAQNWQNRRTSHGYNPKPVNLFRGERVKKSRSKGSQSVKAFLLVAATRYGAQQPYCSSVAVRLESKMTCMKMSLLLNNDKTNEQWYSEATW